MSEKSEYVLTLTLSPGYLAVLANIAGAFNEEPGTKIKDKSLIAVLVDRDNYDGFAPPEDISELGHWLAFVNLLAACNESAQTELTKLENSSDIGGLVRALKTKVGWYCD